MAKSRREHPLKSLLTIGNARYAEPPKASLRKCNPNISLLDGENRGRTRYRWAIDKSLLKIPTSKFIGEASYGLTTIKLVFLYFNGELPYLRSRFRENVN
jgi:hypothetical protein